MSETFFTAPEGKSGVIRNVPFVDTPEALDDQYTEDPVDYDSVPYVPSYNEWKSLEDLVETARRVAATGVFFGALSLIVTLIAFLHK
jgi:hypothetical protein